MQEKYDSLIEGISKNYDIDSLESKNKKIVYVVASFIASNYSYSMNTLAELTGISSSSCQRYLNETKVITELFGEEECLKVQNALKDNLLKAKKLGGNNSFKNNDQLRDENGHFIGAIKTETPDKDEKKNSDIIMLVNLYLADDNPSLSIYSKQTGLTEDYIYDCLTSSKVKDLMGEEKMTEIREKLSSNAPKNIERSYK